MKSLFEAVAIRSPLAMLLVLALGLATPAGAGAPGPDASAGGANAYSYTDNALRIECIDPASPNTTAVKCVGTGSGGATPWTPTGQATLSVSTSSSRVALPSADTTVLIENTGATAVSFKLGNGSVTAATTDFNLSAGHSVVVAAGASVDIAAITASSTSSLSITTGTGTPTISGGGGSGSGSGGDASAANQVTANGKLDTLHTDLGTVITNTGASATAANQTSANTKLDTLHSDLSGISTAANQTSANTKLDTLHTDLGTLATSAAQTTAQTSLTAIASSVANILAPFAGTATATITRPADTTAYAVNDAWADSTSAPTSGGFTLSNVCSASGKTSALTTLTVVSSNDPATTLQGEIWLFNSSVTAVNDNAAFALSDADSIKLVGKVPFSLETSQNGSGTNSIFVANGLDLHVTCSGSANLRFLVKVKNAFTPASAEALQVAFAFKGDN